MQDGAAGFVSRARAIDDQIFLSGNERWILHYLPGGKPLCAGDDHQIRQQVEGQANVNDKHILI